MVFLTEALYEEKSVATFSFLFFSIVLCFFSIGGCFLVVLGVNSQEFSDLALPSALIQ